MVDWLIGFVGSEGMFIILIERLIGRSLDWLRNLLSFSLLVRPTQQINSSATCLFALFYCAGFSLVPITSWTVFWKSSFLRPDQCWNSQFCNSSNRLIDWLILFKFYIIFFSWLIDWLRGISNVTQWLDRIIAVCIFCTLNIRSDMLCALFRHRMASITEESDSPPIGVTVVQLLPDFDGSLEDLAFAEPVSYTEEELTSLQTEVQIDDSMPCLNAVMQQLDPALVTAGFIPPCAIHKIHDSATADDAVDGLIPDPSNHAFRPVIPDDMTERCVARDGSVLKKCSLVTHSRMVGRLIDWLIKRSIHWTVDRLIDWLITW